MLWHEALLDDPFTCHQEGDTILLITCQGVCPRLPTLTYSLCKKKRRMKNEVGKDEDVDKEEGKTKGLKRRWVDKING